MCLSLGRGVCRRLSGHRLRVTFLGGRRVSGLELADMGVVEVEIESLGQLGNLDVEACRLVLEA